MKKDLAKTYRELKAVEGRKYTRSQRRGLIKVLLDMAEELSRKFEEEEIQKLPSSLRIRHFSDSMTAF